MHPFLENFDQCFNIKKLFSCLFRSGDEIGQIVLKSKPRKNRQILRKARLVLPRPVVPDKKPKKYFEPENIQEDNYITSEDNETLNYQVSCSQEYLFKQRTHMSSDLEIETTPDELACYFEQMLFIPKPMSVMAEMMYA